MPPSDHTADALAQLLSDLNAEARSRRDAEHLFTAALVGALGAIALGVGSLNGSRNVIPALIAALLALVMGGTVARKVMIEHNKYVKLRDEQTRIAARLAEEAALTQQDLPEALRQEPETLKPAEPAGQGHLDSLAIILGSTGVTVSFCVWVAGTLS